ncbi:site-specific DNA-methyltransferase [Candidatus Thorarchaeota archaeon]|nr:MAG: site-specific DNA-methyltransferase [Candidatus Thorarchaeota archaeon]
MEQWSNCIFLGECLAAMKHLENSLQEQIQLIYIDPPFFSGTDYTLKEKSEGDPSAAPELKETPIFSDKWEGGLREYLAFMRPRLEKMHALLKSSGSLWVHVDFHVAHYLKVMLDEIFGYENFVNQIVWKRTNSPKSQTSGFGNQHDLLLLYAKDHTEFSTETVYRKHDERSLRPYSYEDDRGRFRLIEIEAHGIQRTEGRKQFEWRGRRAPYLYSEDTLEKWWKQGRIYTSRNGRYSKKQYLSERKGVPVSDLWIDISPIQGSSAEYTGFSTQKPLALLSRIIESATRPADLVADFFVGSGTTAIAAEKLGRRWIVCDSQEVAVDLLLKRLRDMERDQKTEYKYTVLNIEDDTGR